MSYWLLTLNNTPITVTMRNKRINLNAFAVVLCGLGLTIIMAACARMGQPDGGWYDETPPHILSASPADKSVNVKAKKIYINFDEFIQIENAQEKVIVSPPQIEQPEIKSQGKRIVVSLKDSLKENVTYTVDFSDAITDITENNPLGNYTYSFSTGTTIDTLEVSGYVVDAQTLEPVKGILVGLYDCMADSAFTTRAMTRVSRTDDAGHFVVKGVAPGSYRVYALEDADGNFYYNQKSERMAFDTTIVVPTFKDDIRQDTIWRDSLHIESIEQVKYTHFLPDDIVLRAFTTTLTDRYLVKTDRTDANHFTLFFSYGDTLLPKIRGLNFDASTSLLTEASLQRDTITYWLRDTALVNQDTLRMELQYQMTDTTGVLRMQTDTLELVAKTSYASRIKEMQKKKEEWQKTQDKARKKGKPYQEVMPAETVGVKYDNVSQTDPDQNVRFTFTYPVERIDTSLIHLYTKVDTTWYDSKFKLRQVKDCQRTYEIVGEWRPDREYSLEIDSMAFTDIYGRVSAAKKIGFKVHSLDDYGSLFVNIPTMKGRNVICQLLDQQDKPVKEVITASGTAEFFYIKPATYYLRMIVDANGNGKWDTGDFAAQLQPDLVYYYPDEIVCKAKWDVTQSWNPETRKLYNQKPAKLIKQQSQTRRKIKGRNEQRAKNLGIQYNPK